MYNNVLGSFSKSGFQKLDFFIEKGSSYKIIIQFML